jgi:hypothetical protein
MLVCLFLSFFYDVRTRGLVKKWAVFCPNDKKKKTRGCNSLVLIWSTCILLQYYVYCSFSFLWNPPVPWQPIWVSSHLLPPFWVIPTASSQQFYASWLQHAISLRAFVHLQAGNTRSFRVSGETRAWAYPANFLAQYWVVPMYHCKYHQVEEHPPLCHWHVPQPNLASSQSMTLSNLYMLRWYQTKQACRLELGLM